MKIKITDDWFEKEQLHFAAQDGDIEKVQTLLQEGYDINAFDELGKTPLHYAAETELYELVSLLLKQGADVNAHFEPGVGNTPLSEIAGTCSLKIAEILIKAGADPLIPGWMQLTAVDRAKQRKRGDGPKIYSLMLAGRRQVIPNQAFKPTLPKSRQRGLT